MENGIFEGSWPRDGLQARIFAHEVMNYRYHWHDNLYELSILLSGTQEYCRGTEPYQLESGDVILTRPGLGHASISREANTLALVLHFSSAAFRPWLGKGEMFDFDSCRSWRADRSAERYRLLRRYAAMYYLALSSDSPYANQEAKGSLLLLITTLLREFEPTKVSAMSEDEALQQSVSVMLRYLEKNYRSKVSLQELADRTGYNRTYVSTLFRNSVGLNFHDYLTRIRFQHALLELAVTDKNLTDIALDNGFSDLKSMNAVFREILRRTPAEYRAELAPERIFPSAAVGNDDRRYISSGSPFLQARLRSFL